MVFFTHIGSFLGRRHGLEQIQEPVRADVVSKLQHLWIIAPELVLQAVGEADVLSLELLVRARPFSELDDDGFGDGQPAECPHVGPEAVRQHIGVTAVILGPSDSEAVAKAIELLGVDGIDIETALEQGLDDRPVRRLDGDMDLARRPSACFQQPGDHVTEARPPVREFPLSDFRTCVVVQRDDMLLRCPINTYEPFSLFMHHALSADWCHGWPPLMVHANSTQTIRASPQPQPVPVSALSFGFVHFL
jgi:hypothetical protein